MEGWYIRRLILDRDCIRSNVYSNSISIFDSDLPLWDLSTNSYIPEVELDSLIDNDENLVNDNINRSDVYFDLLEIESKINLLIDNGTIKGDELTILNLIFDGDSFLSISRILNKSKPSVISTFRKICAKIAFFLGEYFTNEGYIDYMVNKYKLDSKQEDILRRYINND